MLLASVLFGTMTALVKMASNAGLPASEIIFYRNLIGLPVVAVWAWRRHVPVRPRQPWVVLSRALTGVSAMVSYYMAITVAPIAAASSLKQLAPFFIAVLSWPILKERVRGSTWLLVAVGLCGAVLLISPDLATVQRGSGWGVASAFLTALSFLALRSLGKTEHPDTVVLWFLIIGLFATAPFAVSSHVVPTGSGLLALLGVAATSALAQMAVTRAYAYERAAVLGTLDYVTVLVATFYSVAFFGETLQPIAWVGAGVIAAAGIGVSLLRSR